MDKIEFGKKIREIRKSKNLTQEKFAEVVDISTMYLGEIERGLKMPSMNTFIKIIEALDVSADYVLRYEIASGREHVHNELTRKLDGLTPKQRKTVIDIVNAYIDNL